MAMEGLTMAAIIDEDFENGNWITEVQRLRKLEDPKYKADLEICEELAAKRGAKPEDKTDAQPA